MIYKAEYVDSLNFDVYIKDGWELMQVIYVGSAFQLPYILILKKITMNPLDKNSDNKDIWNNKNPEEGNDIQ